MTGSAFARSSDPATSHEAAAGVNANSLEMTVVEALKELGPSTSFEAATHLDIHPWSISPRFRPLARKGLIRDTKTTRATKPGSNRKSIVWEAV